MAQYLLVMKQQGNTIGCGIRVEHLDANDLDEAKEEAMGHLVDSIDEETGEVESSYLDPESDYCLEFAYIVNMEHTFDVHAMGLEIMSQRSEAAKKAEEEAEKAEYERLKAKFEEGK